MTSAAKTAWHDWRQIFTLAGKMERIRAERERVAPEGEIEMREVAPDTFAPVPARPGRQPSMQSVFHDLAADIRKNNRRR